MLNLHTIITFSNFDFGRRKNITDERTNERTDGRTNLVTLSLLELLIAAKNCGVKCAKIFWLFQNASSKVGKLYLVKIKLTTTKC